VGLWSKGTGLLRFARDLRGLLRATIDVDGCARVIAQGVAQREQRFLTKLERAVYANPSSPYRRLLAAAGCERGDVERLVRTDGLDATLITLARAGVQVSFDELKCRQPAVRGSQTFHFRPEDFDDPLVSAQLSLRSGGTRGAPLRVPIDTEHIAELAPSWAVFLAENGCDTSPLLFWTPGHAGVAARYLACALFGQRYARWFVSEEMHAATDRLYARCVHELSRRAGGFPRAERASFSDPSPVLRCLLELVAQGQRPCVNTAPSAAAKLALLAKRRGDVLDGITFLLGSEPLTAARRATIEASGARAVALYGSSEAPWVGGQCQRAAHADAVHVLLDGYAVVAADEPSYAETHADRTLLLTSLRHAVPKVLLNADIGDRAIITGQRCGCLYDRLGCRLRLHSIRSSDKITELGVTFAVRDVCHVLEDVLPRRIGGVAGDYQLVEARDRDGLPCYVIVVNPELRDVDDAGVPAAFLAELARLERHYRFMASTWERDGLIQVRRGAALASASGKVLAFHRTSEGPPAAAAGR